MVMLPYDTLVMTGGGVRCLWQAGFLSVVGPRWAALPARVVAVSAGAAIACAFASERLEVGVEAFKAVVARNTKNVYPSRLFSGTPLFPHEAMYGAVLADVLNDAGMAALQRGPDVEVLLCRPPRHLPSAVVAALLLGIGLGRQLSSWRVRATVVRVGRLRPEFVSVRSCRDAAGVVDLVLASSSTPPFTPLASYRGRHALDGGVLESVPMSGVRTPGSSALVLLTGRHARPARPSPLPADATVTTVGPSRYIDGAPWDDANPPLLEAFYALGREDGARFLESGA